MTVGGTMAEAPEDAELLRVWRDDRKEEAFSGMVRRHLGMVYGVAFRRTEHKAMAEEVTCAEKAASEEEAKVLDRLKDRLQITPEPKRLGSP